MEIVVTIGLVALLLINLAALVITLQANTAHRQRVRYLESLVERTKTLVAQKDAANIRQHREIAGLVEQCSDLEAELSAFRHRHAALQASYQALQQCYTAQEKVIREKGWRRPARVKETEAP